MRFYTRAIKIEIIIKVRLRFRIKVNPKARINPRIQVKSKLLKSLFSLLKLANLNNIDLKKAKFNKKS